MNRTTVGGSSLLSKETLNWVERQAGAGFRVVTVTPLKGGISSAVYGVKIKREEMLPGPPEVYRDWIDTGLGGLTPRLIARRLDEYAESLVRKMAWRISD
ncbi:hypothetical protein [Paenibacillus macerans]|uniref:hypothetical protein n=1 Tax=Paenibacillus macerans TaxID=44252 RepID=UPI003D30F013